MNPEPEARPIRVTDGRANPPAFIPATIIRYFQASRLSEVEAAWSPDRSELAVARGTLGIQLESSHWNWMGKAERVEKDVLSLVAVKCEGDVQGLMAIPLQSRPAMLAPGERLVYVDYLEAAPWNQRLPGRAQRFLGIGRVLIAQAIRISRELGLAGRVGLHSLPQAELFYATACRMPRTGPDPNYYGLVYFKYTGDAALAWLAAEGIDI